MGALTRYDSTRAKSSVRISMRGATDKVVGLTWKGLAVGNNIEFGIIVTRRDEVVGISER